MTKSTQEAVETTKRSVSAPKCQSQDSYSSELFKFHDFFHDLFKCFKTLGLVVTLKIIEIKIHVYGKPLTSDSS